MDIEWSRDFDRQLDRMESDESERGRQVLQLLAFMLGRLRALEDEPAEESAMFKRVRQSGRFTVWRVSHPYREGVALRLICRFPPGGGSDRGHPVRRGDGSHGRRVLRLGRRSCRPDHRAVVDGERGSMMAEKDFVSGNDRIDRLHRLSGVEDAVAALDAEADEMDRVHAMSLAMVREAGKRTQADIARELHVSQGAVSQLENRSDMLLSTLRGYLVATGATNPRIVISVNGRDVALEI